MRNGRHAHFSRRRNRRPVVLVISLVLVLALAIGGTVAYLVTRTNPVNNTFTPTDVKCEVVKTNNGIKVKNTGSIDAYIRVYLTANYVNGEKHVCANHTVTVSASGTNWSGEGNGIYYYSPKVPSKGFTDELIITTTQTTTDNCTLKVDAFASAIQPGDAALKAWKGVG